MKSLWETLWQSAIVGVHGPPIAINVQIAHGVPFAFPVVFQIRTVNIAAFAKEIKATVSNVVDTKPMQSRFTWLWNEMQRILHTNQINDRTLTNSLYFVDYVLSE